jgi:hypothetical protein
VGRGETKKTKMGKQADLNIPRFGFKNRIKVKGKYNYTKSS